MRSDDFVCEFNCLKPCRLDIALKEQCGDFSRSALAQAIKNNLVLLNDKVCQKPSKMLEIGDKITLKVAKNEQKQEKESKNCELFSQIITLYEDDDLMVISKPAGLVVHDAPSLNEPTLVDWLKMNNKELSTIGGEFRAGIVHRLDRLTSGAMVIAKSDFASIDLSAQLKDKSASRLYLALLDLPLKENCVIDRAIGRCESNRLKKAVYPANNLNAKKAKSAFCNIILDDLEFQKNANLIAAKLFTGRTHQIRAHLASINRHILGDILYGFKGSCDILLRIFLHAFILEFIHPRTKEKMKFKAPLPAEFATLLGEDKEILDEKLENTICSAFNTCDSWVRLT